MTAADFLKAVLGVMPRPPSPAQKRLLLGMATRLGQEFSAHKLTIRVSDATAARLPDLCDFATLAAIVRGEIANDSANDNPPGAQTPRPTAGSPRGLAHLHWVNWIAGAGADAQRMTRLSIARANAAPETWDELREVWRDLIERLRPDWLPFDPATRAVPRAQPAPVPDLRSPVGETHGPSGAQAPAAPADAPAAAPARKRVDDVGMLAGLEEMAAKGDAIAATRAKALRARLYPPAATGPPDQAQAEASA